VDLVNVGDIIIGKYEVTRVLGKGGMGLVVAARHLELGKIVALKFLLPKARESPGIAARFAQEARTGTRIKNEHVADVYDVGTVDGTPFMVMEHLDGKDLAAVIRERGQLPVDEAVDLLLQACEAIAEAHTLGIVHRDLKPSNLFVTARSDGTPFVKVLDFGISKTTTTDDVSVTGSTGVLGSPRYMPPEQLASPGTVDARADVWALGVILYEMLAAAPPFGGDSFEEVYAAILGGTFQALSERRKDVPPQLGEAVAEALAGKRTMRLGSVEAFAGRLAPFGTGAARASDVRIRGIVARAAAASNARSVAPDGTAAPAGAGGTATESRQGTEPGLTRTEGPTPSSRKRWRWPAAGLGALAAVALGAFLRHEGYWPGAERAAVGCAARGAAACESECAAKNFESCYQLGKILDKGVLAPKDQARAATLYKSACDAGVYAACNNLGTLYGSGEGVPKDESKAVALYNLACDHELALACVNLGVMHYEGKGLPKNESAGARLFFQGCQAGEPLGCLSASVAYGEGRGVPRDLDQSFSYAERACAGGAAGGCVRVAKAKVLGEGVTKDVKGGLAELDGLCTGGEAPACRTLGSFYVKGVGSDVPADPVRTREYERRGCNLGSKEACADDAFLAAVDRGETPGGQLIEMLVKRCDEGRLFECGLLGEDLIDGNGMGVDRGRGMGLLERACEGKVERACGRLRRERGE